MITYSEFLNRIKEEVSDLVEDGYTVQIVPVRRNNAVMLDSMMIARPGDRICPNIYLNTLYEWHREGMSIRRIADRILMQYRQAVPDGALDVEGLLSRDTVCGNIVYRVVNRFRNRDLLDEVPHRDLLDLSLVFYILVKNAVIGDGAVMVRREHQKLWGMSDEELDHAARTNTPVLLPPQLMSMEEMLGELGAIHGHFPEAENGEEDSGQDNPENMEDCHDSPIYVLTNTDRQFGACYMARKDILGSLAAKEADNLYILPSSVHECMIIPVRFGQDPEDLGAMVREINRTQVEAEEYLSDSVYYYDRQTDRLEIAA